MPLNNIDIIFICSLAKGNGMFIKRTKGGSKTNPIIYLQIVQSYRDTKGKPKHKVIATLGREADLIQSGNLDSLIKKLSELTDTLLIVDKLKDKSGQAQILGPILAVDALWKKLHLKAIFDAIQRNHQFQYNLNQLVKLMVLNRFVKPVSKRKLMQWKDKIFGTPFQNVKSYQVYRSLSVLAEHKDVLQKKLYDNTLSLFKPTIRLIFYDLTTTYFESLHEDGFRALGYSKDNKTDCVQVVIGLLLSEENLPLGYEVFPGNTYEGTTVLTMVEKLQYKYDVEKIILVGDKGLLNKTVLETLEHANYEYIVAAKLPQLKQSYHPIIQDLASYDQISEELKMKEIEVEGRRLILGYSSKRARRDQHMRNTMLDKLKKRLGKDPKSIGAKSPYRKYLTIQSCSMQLDENKIQAQSKWDGLFGFYSNNPTLTKTQILEAYRMLWQIEESFRCMKTTLEIRPIYHWKKENIEGHIMMCFISFYVLRAFQHLLEQEGIELSAEIVLERLNEIMAMSIKTASKEFWIRSEITGEANKILRTIGCKLPHFILKEQVVE